MSAHKLLALFTASLLLYGLGARGQAQTADTGRAICGEVEKALDAFGRFGHTSCTPSRGSTPSAVSLLLMCNRRVLAAEETKKAWLLFSVAAVGKSLNSRPAVQADEVWLNDVDGAKVRTAFVLRAAVAKDLQEKVSTGQISFDGMYTSIQGALTTRALPQAAK